MTNRAVELAEFFVPLRDCFDLIPCDEAGDEKCERCAESCAGGNGKKTFPQTEREPCADGEDRAGCKQHCGHRINADENENAGHTCVSDPGIESCQPLLYGQKLHRHEERNDNHDERNQSRDGAFFLDPHLRARA